MARIEYESSLDEMVDDHFRLQQRSKSFRRWYWQTVAVYVAIVFFSLFALTRKESFGVRLVLGGIPALITALYYAVTYQKSMKARLKKFLRERVGSDGPFLFSVELRENGIWSKHDRTEIVFDWNNVKSIEEHPELVEVIINNGGMLAIRNRGFQSTKDRDDFISAVRKRALPSQPSL